MFQISCKTTDVRRCFPCRSLTSQSVPPQRVCVCVCVRTHWHPVCGCLCSLSVKVSITFCSAGFLDLIWKFEPQIVLLKLHTIVEVIRYVCYKIFASKVTGEIFYADDECIKRKNIELTEWIWCCWTFTLEGFHSYSATCFSEEKRRQRGGNLF